jgi:hypothetical protein
MSQLARQFIAFPKPKDKPKIILPVKVMRDGREICAKGIDAAGREGAAEYKSRTRKMWTRQKGICCLYGYCPDCPGPMALEEATFDHEDGRGGGRRDDRIELPDGTWINGACHGPCNGWKGSRRIDYNAAGNQERARAMDGILRGPGNGQGIEVP